MGFGDPTFKDIAAIIWVYNCFFFSPKGDVKTVQANGEILSWMWFFYSNFKCSLGKLSDADCSPKFLLCYSAK